MSYMAAQALLKTLISGCSSFAAGSVVEGDFNVTQRGVTTACVLYPGPLPDYDTSGLRSEATYEAYADIFVRYADYTSYGALGTLRDAVLATIAAAPCLSGTYFIMAVSSDEPEEIYVQPGSVGPSLICQRLRIVIQENL